VPGPRRRSRKHLRAARGKRVRHVGPFRSKRPRPEKRAAVRRRRQGTLRSGCREHEQSEGTMADAATRRFIGGSAKPIPAPIKHYHPLSRRGTVRRSRPRGCIARVVPAPRWPMRDRSRRDHRWRVRCPGCPARNAEAECPCTLVAHHPSILTLTYRTIVKFRRVHGKETEKRPARDGRGRVNVTGPRPSGTMHSAPRGDTGRSGDVAPCTPSRRGPSALG